MKIVAGLGSIDEYETFDKRRGDGDEFLLWIVCPFCRRAGKVSV